MTASDAGERDARRRRACWERYRTPLHLTDSIDEEFALGGLSSVAETPDIRVVVLPPDPFSSPIRFDSTTVNWIQETRPSPYPGQQVPWGDRWRSTSQALVSAAVYRDDAPWRRYIALHRHGGIEAAAATLSWQRGERTLHVFSLRHMVAIAWVALDLQRLVAERWGIVGPWEVTVAVRSCGGAALGGFAEGWLEPDDFRSDHRVALETHALHHWEVDEIEPGALINEIAERIENTFGSTSRRDMANRGPFEGSFDPRFGW